MEPPPEPCFAAGSGRPVDVRCCVSKQKRHIEGIRQIGILTAIPFVMLAGPVVGYLLGNWLDGMLGTEPYLMIILIILGFVSSGREIYRLIKLATDDRKDVDDDFRA